MILPLGLRVGWPCILPERCNQQLVRIEWRCGVICDRRYASVSRQSNRPEIDGDTLGPTQVRQAHLQEEERPWRAHISNRGP